MQMMTRRILIGAVAAVVVLTVPVAAKRPSFVPDWTFSGSTLAGWHVLGQATWRAVNGELVGTPTAVDGGWLVFDQSFQDIQLGADIRCSAGCKAGVLLRAEKTATGMKGIFVSLTAGDVGGYAVTLDAAGHELSRERLRPAGGMVRFAPTAEEAAAAAAARGGGAGRAGAPAAGRAGGPAGRAGGPAGRAGGPAGRGRGVLASGVTLPIVRPSTALKADDWNEMDIIADANMLRPIVNGGLTGGGAIDEDLGAFGPFALYIGGTGEVRFRDMSYRDLGLKRFPKEQLSPNFQMQHLMPYYYSFSAAAADVNRDGNLDVISGPFVFYGPDFTEAREFYAAQTSNPSTSFSSNWVAFAGDFTGDGWPDVLLASTDNTRLYVNPKGEARRWDMHANVIPPGNVGEISTMKDVNGDGQPDLVYASGGAVRWATPDPAHPTGPWLSTQVSEAGTYTAHGIGAGDINGDGRVDILNAYGWWEQPAPGVTGLWTYHPQAFGRASGRGSEGGAEMGVYDVNGDGLTDVVTSLQAHVFGLAWFEQRRAADGTISFVQHMIADDYSSENAGGVTFSEPHGSTAADMDGDGIPDFIVGKRYFSHHESFLDPDPYGPPVLYVYRTVRNPRAPGGAEFVPELVHNRSGAGSQVLAVDLNKDGVMDLVTSTTSGAYVFFGKPRHLAAR
jgi:3-keto-disaccharide hydrolase/FG-GAP-like repeat